MPLPALQSLSGNLISIAIGDLVYIIISGGLGPLATIGEQIRTLSFSWYWIGYWYGFQPQSPDSCITIIFTFFTYVVIGFGRVDPMSETGTTFPESLDQIANASYDALPAQITLPASALQGRMERG